MTKAGSGRRFGLAWCFMGVFLAFGAGAQAAYDGQVRRARLGVSTKNIGSQMQGFVRQEFGLEGAAGVIVAAVAKGGPAEKAGIRKDDLILRVGSTLITSGQQLATHVSGLQPGQTITVTYSREITVHKTRVTLGTAGSTFEPASDRTPITVTRYAGELRGLLARVQDVERRFAQAGSARAPQATVGTLGMELLGIGTELDRLFNVSAAEMTRFGTMEEADLLEAIRKAHNQAANALKAQAVARLESAERGGTSRNQMRGMLRDVGRELIEREAVRWMRRNGLEELLVENGQAAMGRKVSQGIELNLRTFLDKKSVELVGMPLGGFRSIKAAFRLQARRQVRELVANLVLNFSGNQLVVQLLQKHLVRWIETDLWPQLREAFRPKTHLARRVRISAGTMAEASEGLNGLVRGRQPAAVPLAQVQEAVARAEGKLYAARYLERDLKRAGNQALTDDLNKAKDRLQRDIRRIRHQFLIADVERMGEINDNLEYMLGVHDDVGKILAAMTEEDRRIRAAAEHFFRVMMRKDMASVMALIHEQSPLHSEEVLAALRQYFETHAMVSDGVTVTKVTKRSDEDVEAACVEKSSSSTQAMGLVFRRSGGTWKLYGPGGGS